MMFLSLDIIRLIVFLVIVVLFSRRSSYIQWNSTGILVVINLFLTWFFMYFPWGKAGVQYLANGIAWVIASAHAGTGFAFASWVNTETMDMAVSALFPILLVVPLFDILMY